MRHAKTLLMSTLLAVSLSAAIGTQRAHAITTPDIDPEVASNVWQENNVECASVSLNGKELVCFKGEAAGKSAEDRAEDLAEKIKDLLDDDKFDPDKLLPAREGNVATLRMDGNVVLKFDGGDNACDQSFKVANAIRQSTGAQQLPASFVKLAALTNGNGKIDMNAIKALSGVAMKAMGTCFSGAASWYGGKFHGRKAADGSRFDQDGLTAAHRSLPFGTKLLVMNRKTGDSCVVEVNDRGPFVGDRVIDLSRGAAKQLNMISSGVAVVDCLVLDNQ